MESPPKQDLLQFEKPRRGDPDIKSEESRPMLGLLQIADTHFSDHPVNVGAAKRMAARTAPALAIPTFRGHDERVALHLAEFLRTWRRARPEADLRGIIAPPFFGRIRRCGFDNSEADLITHRK